MGLGLAGSSVTASSDCWKVKIHTDCGDPTLDLDTYPTEAAVRDAAKKWAEDNCGYRRAFRSVIEIVHVM